MTSEVAAALAASLDRVALDREIAEWEVELERRRNAWAAATMRVASAKRDELEAMSTLAKVAAGLEKLTDRRRELEESLPEPE